MWPRCAWSLFQHQAGRRRKYPSIRLSKKTSIRFGVCGAWCRRWIADFEACSAHFGWFRIPCLRLRSHKNAKFLKMLGVRHTWAKSTREGRFFQKDAPKRSVLPFELDWSFVFCSNECDLQEDSSILDCGLFRLGSVEVSWVDENAGNTHLEKTLALLLRARVCVLFCNCCDLLFQSHSA